VVTLREPIELGSDGLLDSAMSWPRGRSLKKNASSSSQVPATKRKNEKQQGSPDERKYSTAAGNGIPMSNSVKLCCGSMNRKIRKKANTGPRAPRQNSGWTSEQKLTGKFRDLVYIEGVLKKSSISPLLSTLKTGSLEAAPEGISGMANG